MCSNDMRILKQIHISSRVEDDFDLTCKKDVHNDKILCSMYLMLKLLIRIK